VTNTPLVMTIYLHPIRLTGIEILELLDHFLKTTAGVKRKAALAALVKPFKYSAHFPT